MRPGFGALIAVCLVLLAPPVAAHADIACGGKRATISGTSGPDSVQGTSRNDVIRTGGGDDLIEGGGGNDTICAGPGDDVMSGDPGNDLLRMGAGTDGADGSEGDDQILGLGGAGDDADGGPGVDGCLTEDHRECEADLRTSATGSPPYTGGDQRVFVGQLRVFNEGPSPATLVIATGSLPSEAEFVASASDPRCREVATDELGCRSEGPEVGQEARFDVGFRFPDCPSGPNHQITFRAVAEDTFTTDPNRGNNQYSVSLPLEPAPSCTGRRVSD